MSRNIKFSIGEFYHIYNRGTDKRIIFARTDDYYRFLVLLYLCNSKQSVDIGDYLRQGSTLSELLYLERSETLIEIGAYCLMPNHFHILVKEKSEGGISLFMQKLTTAYTMYFNKKYNRSGTLLQGKFKGSHIQNDNHLKYLFAYIGLNPVKLIEKNWKEEGIRDSISVKKFLINYKFSSFLDHYDFNRNEKSILSMKGFPQYFKLHKEFENFIDDWLNFKDEF